MTALGQLIIEARTLAGGAHPCNELGHRWRFAGGRLCTRVDPEGCPNQSQSVFECDVCGDVDYGEPGGPGWNDCEDNCYALYEHRIEEGMPA